jgi:hypothetical protein
MPMDFSTYIMQLNDAILAENGPNLAYLLRPTSPHGKELVKEFRNPSVSSTITWFDKNPQVHDTSVPQWEDTKDACKALGMISLFNMFWSALMWRKRDTLKRLRRSRNLFRE